MRLGNVAVGVFGVATILLFGLTPVFMFGLMTAGIATDGVDPVRWYSGLGALIALWVLDLCGWAALIIRSKRQPHG